MTKLVPSDWLEALQAEFEALARGSLGFASVEHVGRVDEPPSGMEGAYLALLAADGPSCQVGLVSTSEGCRALAEGLLGTAAPDGPLSAPDVADAVCEVVNMLAGGVQRRLRQKSDLTLGLGLPTFFHGPVQTTDRLGVTAAAVRLAGLPAALLVVHPRTRS
ncbi:MAG TPA: chemotaxis protein CheX [Anaeromyxobacteraceae bacterium]|nr:chemotaxis protein CheX [Anaeromyxobacteraceae bacterium]